ncbi:MAG: hypothetical protein JWO95_3215 [Verrucomicrobiales bacterium]|nr:hypothetical protein [Verrucomicrobiales bacterium]
MNTLLTQVFCEPEPIYFIVCISPELTPAPSLAWPLLSESSNYLSGQC